MTGRDVTGSASFGGHSLASVPSSLKNVKDTLPLIA